jgi:membrane protein
LESRTLDRGREAARPSDIPASGWKDVLFRVRRRIAENNLSITAAGVAFYALIATFPGLLALFGVTGWVFDVPQVSEQFGFAQDQLQPEATLLLAALIRGLAQSDRSRLGFGVAGGALVTLWGVSLGGQGAHAGAERGVPRRGKALPSPAKRCCPASNARGYCNRFPY